MKQSVLAVATVLCAAFTATAQTDGAPTTLGPAMPPMSTPEGALTLSREKCIEIALTESPTIRVADMEIQRMDYSRKETISSLFPEIDFAANYQRAIQLQTISMEMGGQVNNIKMGRDNTWDLGFTAAMPIVNPQLWKSIMIGKTQVQASVESARQSRLDMVNQVNKAYYGWLLAYASYDVIRQNYDIARLNAEIYEKQFALGTASEYDVLRSSVQVKNVEPDLLQAEIAVKQCALALKVLMGMDSQTEIVPDITLKDLQQDMYGYAMSVDRSLKDNSSLRSLDIQTKMVKQNLDLKKFAFIPTLAAQYSLKWSAMSNGNPFKDQNMNPYSNVALALNFPIITWGKRWFGVKGADVQLKEMALQRENLVNSLNMQVDLALDNINKELKQISSSEESVRQAEKAYAIMQKSFEIGAATYLNLRDAELANTSAKLSYYQAIYNYLVSTSELDLLLGKEDVINRYPATAK